MAFMYNFVRKINSNRNINMNSYKLELVKQPIP